MLHLMARLANALLEEAERQDPTPTYVPSQAPPTSPPAGSYVPPPPPAAQGAYDDPVADYVARLRSALAHCPDALEVIDALEADR